MMKKTMVAFIIMGMTALMSVSPASAAEMLKYSCSAQILEAFGMERLEAFTKETGIRVEIYKSSSQSAVNRMMNGFSDIASTTRSLLYVSRESGYAEIPFCKDNLAVITSTRIPVDAISADQLCRIFSKTITNWKALGGPDKEITVIIPGKNTAAYQNFKDLVMQRNKIRYDFISTQSSDVIDAVKRLSGGISFITYGAVSDKKAIKCIEINGMSPKNTDYPYHQTFYFVTKGQPTGPARAFVDFVFSGRGREIIISKGMIPLKR